MAVPRACALVPRPSAPARSQPGRPLTATYQSIRLDRRSADPGLPLRSPAHPTKPCDRCPETPRADFVADLATHQNLPTSVRASASSSPSESVLGPSAKRSRPRRGSWPRRHDRASAAPPSCSRRRSPGGSGGVAKIVNRHRATPDGLERSVKPAAMLHVDPGPGHAFSVPIDGNGGAEPEYSGSGKLQRSTGTDRSPGR